MPVPRARLPLIVLAVHAPPLGALIPLAFRESAIFLGDTPAPYC
jgi:hypothetical protein